MSQEPSGRISHSTASTRAFRSRLNVSATFSQTLLNLGAIVVHGKRKTEVAHLAEVAISCIMARDRSRSEWKESWRACWTENESVRTVYRLRSRTRTIVRYEWLSRWTFPYPSVRSCALLSTAYQIFSMLKISIGPYRRVRLADEIMFAKMRARSSEKGTFGRV